jgi:hypothetical protein
MPDVMQSLWVGRRLSTMERLCISSFLYQGYPFHLYVYEETEGIPPGTVVRDGNTVLPSSRIFTYKEHQTYAGFSNFFRYKLLLDHGGWWVDADTLCLKSFCFSSDYVFSSEGLNGRQTVNAGVMKMPRGSAAARYCWDTCQEFDTEKLKWGQCGPQLLGRAVEACLLGEYVQPPKVFCPIHFTEWKKVLDPKVGCPFEEGTYSVHLWNELWRRADQDRNSRYEPGCLYEQWKHRYLGE